MPTDPKEPLSTNVFQLDLDQVAKIIGCDYDEVYANLHGAEQASEIEGTILDKGKQLVFGIEEDSPKTFEPPRATTALISAAARPGTIL